MKKINGKALFGVGAGLIATVVGACCLFKKNNDEDYAEHEVECDDDAEVDESVDEVEEG